MEFPEEYIASPKDFAEDVAAKARGLRIQKNLAKVDPDRTLHVGSTSEATPRSL